MVHSNLRILQAFWAILLSAIIFASAVPSNSAAGEWTKLSDSYDSCNFRFSGEILPGDLTGYVETLSAHSYKVRVCLNSEGGSFSEVYKFLKLVNSGEESVSVATRIEQGDVCLSSCALLFMFGEGFGANSPYPSRELEAGGKLGFHSPFISPERENGVEAADAFRVAIQISKLLIDSSYKALTTRGSAFPPELVAVILGTPNDEMYIVDKIGELGLFGITLLPPTEQTVAIEHHRAPVIDAVKRICATSYTFTNRNHFVKTGYSFADLLEATSSVERAATTVHHLVFEKMENANGVKITAMLSGPYYVPGWYSAGAILYCQVELITEYKDPYFAASAYDVKFGGPSFDFDSRLANDSDGTSRGMRVGLTPVDTLHR